MEYTSLVDGLGKVHFLDGDLFGFADVSLTGVNDPIGPRINFLPVLIVGNISKRVGQELKESLA